MGFGRPAPDVPPVPPERRGATVRRIVTFFRPYRGQVAVVLVAILITSFLGLINPYLSPPLASFHFANGTLRHVEAHRQRAGFRYSVPGWPPAL